MNRRIKKKKLRLKDTDIIVLRFNLKKHTCSFISQVVTNTVNNFPNHKVIALPDDFSISFMNKEQFSKMKEYLNN